MTFCGSMFPSPAVTCDRLFLKLSSQLMAKSSTAVLENRESS